MPTRPVLYCPFDRDEVKGALDEARAIVTELELDDDLKAPAFGYAVQALLNRSVEAPEVPTLLHGIPLPGGHH